jgi:hypothetical protein
MVEEQAKETEQEGFHVVSSLRIFYVFHDKREEILRTGIYSTRYPGQTNPAVRVSVASHSFTTTNKKALVYVCWGGREEQICILAVEGVMALTDRNIPYCTLAFLSILPLHRTKFIRNVLFLISVVSKYKLRLPKAPLESCVELKLCDQPPLDILRFPPPKQPN